MAFSPEGEIQACLRRVDSEGRFSVEDSKTLRVAIAELEASGRDMDHPGEIFGSWDGLTADAQNVLRRLVEEDISRTMACHPRGLVWPWIGQRLYVLSKALRRTDKASRLADSVEVWSARIWKSPANLRARIRRRSILASWEKKEGVSVEGLLAAIGRTPAWLLGDYAEAVKVDTRARGFHLNRERNVAWGYLIGIDLILAPDGVWCVEANLNTAAYNDEYRYHWDSTGGIRRVFEAAREWGFDRIWWHDQDLREISPWLMATLLDTAAANEMEVIAKEDYRVPPRPGFPSGLPRPGKRLTSPLNPPPDTLVVRRNGYGVGSDKVISDKEPFIRTMAFELSRTGDERCRVPGMTRMPPEPFPEPSENLPNLVYKYPSWGKGEGVFFLRARDRGHAVSLARSLDRERGEPPGLFQHFVRSRLLPGRRVYDVRSEILVTPMGIAPILSFRREASKPLPDTVEDGIVPNPGNLTSNVSTGGTATQVPPEEEPEILSAVHAIGEALVRSFQRGFEVEE